MHLSCYKIKLYYYYLLLSLRYTSTVFTSCVISKSYKSCTDVTDIHLPRSVSSFLGSFSSPYLSTLSFSLSLSVSLLHCLFRSVHLARSLSSCLAVCQVRRRHTPGIVLMLSYVAAAIVSSLRSSAIPLTAAYVSNACRGMSGDSLRKVGRERDARMHVVRIKGRITGN